MSQTRFVIGVSGRSGSGKSTLVRKIMDYYGSDYVCLHTMDNYYLPREEQLKDDREYLNFDLPSSFYRERFYQDLLKLRKGEVVEIEEYVFNNKEEGDKVRIYNAPVVLVEGLFIYHYDEIRELLDYKIMMDVSRDTCYDRRLQRDVSERNYNEEEVTYRYDMHVEPSYQAYIAPYVEGAHMMIDNEHSMEDGWTKIQEVIGDIIE